MNADSLLSIEIKSPPPEEFEYKTPIEMDQNNRSKKFLKLHIFEFLQHHKLWRGGGNQSLGAESNYVIFCRQTMPKVVEKYCQTYV